MGRQGRAPPPRCTHTTLTRTHGRVGGDRVWWCENDTCASVTRVKENSTWGTRACHRPGLLGFYSAGDLGVGAEAGGGWGPGWPWGAWGTWDRVGALTGPTLHHEAPLRGSAHTRARPVGGAHVHACVPHCHVGDDEVPRAQHLDALHPDGAAVCGGGRGRRRLRSPTRHSPTPTALGPSQLWQRWADGGAARVPSPSPAAAQISAVRTRATAPIQPLKW